QIGSVDRDPKRFRKKIVDFLPRGIEVVSVHHAEDLFPAVSAASIIAKTTRDGIIRALRNEFGDFGSGYPSDPKTRDYLMGYAVQGKALPRIVRASWKTTKNIMLHAHNASGKS
ncbi:MAG: ribonuclease HII, partial [Candidatus Methanomethylicia archaeon]|nr:ribonuclease HII [Candidatus Methanomethylicia archaeon]